MNPQSIYQVGDIVCPADERREIEDFTFEIADETQIEYFERAGRFMIHSPDGIGFWEDNLALVDRLEEGEEDAGS